MRILAKGHCQRSAANDRRARLVGVAIAAALVPPIATSGLALSQGNLELAYNALLLFVVNMFTIVLASTLSLWMVGFRSFRKASGWIINSLITVMVVVLVLGIYLSLKTEEHFVNQPLPGNLQVAVQRELGSELQLEGLEVVYEDFGVQLILRTSGDTLVSEEKAEDIRQLARRRFRHPVQVRLISRSKTGIDLHYHW